MAKILIMEDEELVLQSLIESLEEAGHQVMGAKDGIEGGQMAAAQDFDLTIVDIFMPDQDGIATIMKLKKTRPDLKVIAISGGGALVKDYDYLEYAKALGAVHCFYKPIDPDELLSCIQSVTT